CLLACWDLDDPHSVADLEIGRWHLRGGDVQADHRLPASWNWSAGGRIAGHDMTCWQVDRGGLARLLVGLLDRDRIIDAGYLFGHEIVAVNRLAHSDGFAHR